MRSASTHGAPLQIPLFENPPHAGLHILFYVCDRALDPYILHAIVSQDCTLLHANGKSSL